MNHLLVIVSLVSLVFAPINQSVANESDRHKAQLDSVARLLGQSSVSKQVLNSENDAAIQHYKLAKSSYEAAVAAYRNGDVDESKALIKKAKGELFEAVVYANIKGVDKAKEKDRQNYDSKRRSVTALLDALDRVSANKGRVEQNKAVVDSATKLISKADDLYFEKQYVAGIAALNKALRDIENAISSMRTGDTLVRSLSFASPVDEYKYELERNNTHFMLLDMCLAESGKTAAEKKAGLRVKKLAEEHRGKAEAYAKQNKYKEAVKQMERSTMNIFGELKKSNTFKAGIE